MRRFAFVLAAALSSSLASVVEGAEPEAHDVASRSPRRGDFSASMYGLLLRQKLWSIPLQYAGAGAAVRIPLATPWSLETGAELLVGQTGAGLSTTLVRWQAGADVALGILHVRPSANLGLTSIGRATTRQDLFDPFVGASLRVGPELALDAHDALALDLSADVGSTSTYGYGVALRYLRF